MRASTDREKVEEEPTRWDNGLTPALLDRLRDHLGESIVVINAEGLITASLNPPGGILGRGAGIGRHIFEYCSSEELPRSLEIATEALGSEPGWSASWTVRLKDGDEKSREFEMRIVNCLDDPVVAGFVVRLLEYPERAPLVDPLFKSELGQELESLAGAVPLPIVFLGSDRHVYYLNAAARALAGSRCAALEQEGLLGLAAPEYREEIATALDGLLEAPGEKTLVFKMTSEPDGGARVIEARVHSRGRQTHVLALVATLVDVSASFEREAELRHRASSDFLTGLLNRHALELALEERLATDPEQVGALYVDLDGFKSVNDTLGHAAGDDFLQALAEILRSWVHSADLLARLGGDEFLLVCAPEHVEELTERLRVAVLDLGDAHDCFVTASIGQALGRPGDTARELLRRADRAMYADKRRVNSGSL